MDSPILKCTRESFDLPNGDHTYIHVAGWRYGVFATVMRKMYDVEHWGIIDVHVLKFCLSCVIFLSSDDACAAMIELTDKNINPGKIAEDDIQTVVNILHRHNGFVPGIDRLPAPKFAATLRDRLMKAHGQTSS
jgi:hypothetical protein